MKLSKKTSTQTVSQDREGHMRKLIVDTIIVELETNERYDAIRLPKGKDHWRKVPWDLVDDSGKRFKFRRAVVVTYDHVTTPKTLVVLDKATRAPLKNPDGSYVTRVKHDQALTIKEVHRAKLVNGKWEPEGAPVR